MQPRILFLDIETKPAIAWVWGLHDQNVSLNQLADPGGTLCFGAKWAGSSKMIFHSEWKDGHQGMVEAAHALFCEADAIVTYNGDRFDLPKLRGEFLLAGLPPPPPITSIDVYKAVKKLGFISNKLAFIGPLLTKDEKLKHEGMELWIKAMDREPKALRKMERYCSQDVRLLERVYDRVRPYVTNHPHLSLTGSNACGACGSVNIQSRGIRRTKANIIQRLQCNDCGSWSDGKKAKAA
jgi:hypothetical protein